MSRVVWKGPFIAKSLFKSIKKKSHKRKVWSRSSVVPHIFIRRPLFIHSGKSFKKIYITKEKIGYKCGEFCLSRAFKKKMHSKKLKKKNK